MADPVPLTETQQQTLDELYEALKKTADGLPRSYILARTPQELMAGMLEKVDADYPLPEPAPAPEPEPAPV